MASEQFSFEEKVSTKPKLLQRNNVPYDKANNEASKNKLSLNSDKPIKSDAGNLDKELSLTKKGDLLDHSNLNKQGHTFCNFDDFIIVDEVREMYDSKSACTSDSIDISATNDHVREKENSICDSHASSSKIDPFRNPQSVQTQRTKTTLQNDLCKIPGLSFIIGIKPEEALKSKKILYNCVLCNLEDDAVTLLSSAMKNHAQSRTHLINVMRVEEPALYERFKDRDSSITILLNEILEHESKLPPQKILVVRKKNYNRQRENIIHKIQELSAQNIAMLDKNTISERIDKSDDFAESSREPEDAHKIFVGCIPPRIEPMVVKSYFEKYGKITDFDFKISKKSSGNYGFIVFSNAYNVDDALKHFPHYIEGACVKTERYKSFDQPHNQGSGVTLRNELQVDKHMQTLFIGPLEFGITVESAIAYLEQFGEIVDSHFNRSKSKRHYDKQFGFITYANACMVENFLQKGPHKINGIPVRMQRYLSKKQSIDAEAGSSVNEHEDSKEYDERERDRICTLFVGPLDFEVPIKRLTRQLEQFGEIVKTRFNRSKSLKHLNKQFGFIVYSQPYMVNDALQHGLFKVDGIPVHVARCLPDHPTYASEMGCSQNEFSELKEDHYEKFMRTLYVGPFGLDVPIKRLKIYLAQFGQIAELYFKRSKSIFHVDKHYGFITYSHASIVDEILRCGPHNVDGVLVNMERYMPKNQLLESGYFVNEFGEFKKWEIPDSSSSIRESKTMQPALKGVTVEIKLPGMLKSDLPILTEELRNFSIDIIKDHYLTRMYKIMQLQKDRSQRNIVLVTDERDNFDVTLAGFNSRVEVLRIPGIKFVKAFSSISKHPKFGKGTIFIYCGGTHDFLLSVPLQDCVKFRCPAAKTMLTLRPCASDVHYLVLKSLELNMDILTSTKNDIALFCGILPVLVNQFNSISLSERKCGHKIWKVPDINVSEYVLAVMSYNRFVRYHAETLGYSPLELEMPFFSTLSEHDLVRMLPDGYNICPEEEFSRANQAKQKCIELLDVSSKKYVIPIQIPEEPPTQQKTILPQKRKPEMDKNAPVEYLAKTIEGEYRPGLMETMSPLCRQEADKPRTSDARGRLGVVDAVALLKSKLKSTHGPLETKVKAKYHWKKAKNEPTKIIKPKVEAPPPVMSATEIVEEKCANDLLERIKSLYNNDVKEIMQMLKGRTQEKVVIVTDDRETLNINLSGFDDRVDVMKVADLKFDNAFVSIKQHPNYGKGTIFVFTCGSHDVLLSIPLQDCLEFKCSSPQTMLTVSPCTSDIHYLIRKALELNMNILHSTQNDFALFSGLIPVGINDFNQFMLESRPCIHAHPASKAPTVGFIPYINYNDAIEWFNSFTKYHARALGFAVWDLEAPYLCKKGVTPMLPHCHNISPIDEKLRAQKVRSLCGELLRKMPSGPQIPNNKKDQIKAEHLHVNQKSAMEQIMEGRSTPKNIKMERPALPTIRSAMYEVKLLEKVKSTYKLSLQKILKMQQNRSQNKIVIVTDDREKFDVNLAGFNGKVEVLKISNMTFGNVFSTLKGHPSFGRGTIYAFSGGNEDLIYSVSLPDCLAFNCANPQGLMALRLCTKDTHHLIKKALQLHMNILLNTLNDTVLFCGLVPISVNQYNFHCINKRVCSSRHSVKAIPTVDYVTSCNYDDVIDWYNVFTKYHSEMLSYTPWNLEVRYFGEDGPSKTLLHNSYNFAEEEEIERTNHVKALCNELLPKLTFTDSIEDREGHRVQNQELRNVNEMTHDSPKSINHLSKIALNDSPGESIQSPFSSGSEPDIIPVEDKEQMLRELATSSTKINLTTDVAFDKKVLKYSSNYLERVICHYAETVQKILEMHIGRTQKNIVLVSDERDNFDVSFTGFDKDLDILKIPGMKYGTVFTTLKQHRHFGKGTIFIFSGGNHDLLIPEALQDCLDHRCTRPQAVLSLPPANSDPHFLIAKTLQLNMDILKSTRNDIALFSGLLPVLINQYNNHYLTTRPCFLDHPAWKLPNVNYVIDNCYKCIISWYNDFTKLHAQSLGFEPWDLEAPYFDRISEILLPNGYNYCPSGESDRAKQAKLLCRKLFHKISPHSKKVLPISSAKPSIPASATADLRVSVSKSPLVLDKIYPRVTADKVFDPKLGPAKSRTDIELNEVIYFAKSVLDSIKSDNKKLDRGSLDIFNNIFFIGKRELISPLFACNFKSKMIYHEFFSFEDSDIMTLLTKIGDFPEKSICCLAFDITIITKKLVVSPACLEHSCQQPLFVTALKTSSSYNGQILNEIEELISNQVQSITNFIQKLSQLCIPMIILPLTPERIYCDDGTAKRHQLSHEFANLGAVVVNGSQELWHNVTQCLIRAWNILMVTINKRNDPYNCVSNYVQNKQSTFSFLDSINDYDVHWKAPRLWKAFIEIYLLSLTNINGNEMKSLAIMSDKICDGIVVSKVSMTVPSEFFEELFRSIDRNVKIIREKDQYSLERISFRSAFLLKKLNHYRVGDMILLISLVNEEGNSDPEMNLMEILYISCIFENVYSKWKSQIIANLTKKINRIPNVALYKSKPCKDGSRCKEPKRCLHFHDHQDRRRNPFIQKYMPSMCTMTKNSEGLCREGIQCRNSHNIYESKFHPANFQCKVCPSGLSSKLCNRKKYCEFAHKDSPEMFFTPEWKDMIAIGAQQALNFFSGAIRGVPKVQDLNRLNMRVLFISPSSEFLDVALSASKDLLNALGLKALSLGKEENDHLGSCQVLLGDPKSFLKLNTRVFIQMRGCIIIDDIQRILENELLRSDLRNLLNIITASTYNVVLNKVFICANYDSGSINAISDITGLDAKKLHVLPEEDLKENSTITACEKISSSGSGSLNNGKRSQRSRSSSHGNRSRSRSPCENRKRSTNRRSSQSTRNRSRSRQRNGRSCNRRDRSWSKSHYRYSDQKRSRSKSPSPSSKKFKSNEESVDKKELPAPSLEIQNDLRSRIGLKLFDEYMLTIETMRHDFEEEYLVYRDMPELYSNYAHHYDIFTTLFIAQHGDENEQQKEKYWRVFWKSKYEDVRTEDWKTKLANLTEEFEKRVARNSETTFDFAEALSLLERLCDDQSFYMAPGLLAMIKMCQELGITTKKAYTLLSESDNITILHIALEKFKVLISSAADDKRYLYERAVDWIPKLLDEAEKKSKLEDPKGLDIPPIDLEAIAKFSLGKSSEVTIGLIKTALAYEGISEPAKEVVNQLFLKVCKIHFTLSIE